MEITNYTHQDRHITLVQGLVKEQAFADISQALAAAPPDSTRQLWIDCSHVDRSHLSNSSLCAFVSELLKLKKEHVVIVLCGMNQTTERLFRILNLDSLFIKARTMEEAHLPTTSEQAAA